MDKHKQGNGLETFFEHWGIFLIVIIAMITSQSFSILFRMTSAEWTWVFVTSFVLMIGGGGLIGYAKIPVYRKGQFFTFGEKSVPQHLKRHYRWGRRAFIFGVVLSVCLLLSKP